MRTFTLAFVFLSVFILRSHGQQAEHTPEGIYNAVEKYIVGWRTSDTVMLNEAFVTDHGHIYWVQEIDSTEQCNAMTFGSALLRRKTQPTYGIGWNIELSDIVDNKLAFVKVHIPTNGGYYKDYLTLQKMNGQWKICTKQFVYFKQPKK